MGEEWAERGWRVPCEPLMQLIVHMIKLMRV